MLPGFRPATGRNGRIRKRGYYIDAMRRGLAACAAVLGCLALVLGVILATAQVRVGSTLCAMSRLARRSFSLAAIIGVVCAVALSGLQALTADAPARKVAVDPCATVRPEIIQTLVPHASPPKTGRDVSGLDKVTWCQYSGWTIDHPASDSVGLSIAIVHYGRSHYGSPDNSAHVLVRSAGGCLNCRKQPTPRLIGNESYEHGRGYDDGGRRKQFAEVRVRLGATSITVEYIAEGATLNALLEGARAVAQEVAFRCTTAC